MTVSRSHGKATQRSRALEGGDAGMQSSVRHIRRHQESKQGTPSVAGVLNTLKGAGEIRRILTKELGFKTLADYQCWVRDVRPTLAPTPQLIEQLSPDVVDCREFWKVCEELFGLDPVYNQSVAPQVGVIAHEVDTRCDANRMNLRLAKSLGITAFLEENAGARLKTLEIGPGFGSLKNFIETQTSHIYTGIDVFPRFADVLTTTSDGLIPEAFIEREQAQFAYVVATNVFQHLSARQRSRYYNDAQRLLGNSGLFIFNLQVDTGKLPLFCRDSDGRAWCDHYCQFTSIPTPSELYGELAALFSILYVTQRYDGLFNFVCQKS